MNHLKYFPLFPGKQTTETSIHLANIILQDSPKHWQTDLHTQLQDCHL